MRLELNTACTAGKKGWRPGGKGSGCLAARGSCNRTVSEELDIQIDRVVTMEQHFRMNVGQGVCLKGLCFTTAGSKGQGGETLISSS